jgi:hypothetical protein
VLLFADVIIRNGGALRDVAHAPDDARAREHRLAKRRFARRRVTKAWQNSEAPLQKAWP